MSSFIGNIHIFDHTTQDWQIFYGRLEQFIKLNSITNDRKCPLLLTHLSDESYRLAKNLVHPKKLEEVEYTELVRQFNRHFSPKRCTFADRERFFEARRATGESIEEWAVRVRGLAVHCDFENALDMLLTNKFVLGMNIGPERDRLFEQDAAVLTFAKAVEIAQQAACAREARAAAMPPHIKEESVYRVSGPRPAGGNVRERPEIKCSVCGMKNHDAEKCRYKHYRCQTCGVKGHLKKVCSKKVRDKSNLHNLEVESEFFEGNECKNCKECELFNLRYVKYSPILLWVVINHVELQMELDSGSGTTVISKKMYKQYFSECNLRKCNLKFCLYNGHKISPLGYFETDVKYQNYCHQIKIYVVENGGPPLLGRDFMAKFKFGLTPINNTRICSVSNQCSSEVLQLMREYSDLFSKELGKFNKFDVELKLKQGVVPKFFKPRTVPFALKSRVEDEIDRLVGLGILVPVNFSRYATPIVPVLKDNGKVKIAGDYSITLNKDLHIDKYPMPRIEEVLANLGNGLQYSKIDLSNAYNQFVLSPESQELTTISTTKGLFKYTRLVYGLANAPAIFQRAMESLLIGIDGVSCWLDDVCITGPSNQIHLVRLREVLSRLKNAGLKLQKEKCVFFKNEVTYLGYVIDKNGLRACKKKVEAIVKAPRPTNITEVKRFLGVVNYYRNFVPNASSQLGPLHELLRAGARWEWGDRHERAFENVKRELASERVLAHYEPGMQLVLTVDAGPAGLGAVLAARAPDRTERPLAYASRSLTPSERNYSQIQKEATAIVYGVKHFHQYLYGLQVPFVLRTDHRPLLSIFGNKNGISVMSASRLQRYAIILSAYNYSIEYIASEKNTIADYFSRTITSDDSPRGRGGTGLEQDRSYLKFLDAHVSPITFEDLKRATEKDKTLQTVFKYMGQGWPRKIKCESISPYFNCKADLEAEDGCLFRGHRVVIPTIYRERMLSELHSGHFGIVKTKSIARAKLWWPSIDKDIASYIGSCTACCSAQAAPPRAPPAPWPRPAGAWQRLHIDYMSIGSRDYLIVIDAFSKWLECIHMNNGTSTRALINKLKYLFSRFGIPHVIVSDNDTKINSFEFNSFCSNNGIRHVTSPIYHPASNGLAENAVKTCKKMIKCLLNQYRSSSAIDEKLLGILFEYRNTDHCTTGASPAKLMLGRALRSRLDLILPGCRSRVNSGSLNVQPRTCRKLAIGDRVWLKWYIAKKETWVLGIIRDLVGSRMYDIYVSEYGVICRRHVDQIKKYTGVLIRDNLTDCKVQDKNVINIAGEVPASPPSPRSFPATHSLSPPPTPPIIMANEENQSAEDEWAEAQDLSGNSPEETVCDEVPSTEDERLPTAEQLPAAGRPPFARTYDLRPRIKKVDYKKFL